VLTCPYSLEYCEGIIILEGNLLAAGRDLYPDVNARPLVITAWPPLFYTLLAPIIRFFGDGFLPARILTLLFTILSALMIGLSSRRMGATPYWAAVFALVWVLQPETLFWGAVIRVDMAALFFSLAALCLYLADDPPLPAVGLLLCLAFLTKQSAIAAAGAVIIHAAWGNRRALAPLIGWYLLPSAAVTSMLQAATSGAYLFDTVTFHSLAGLDIPSGLILLINYSARHFPLLLLCVVALIFMGSVSRTVKEKKPAVAILYISLLMLQVVLIFKKGASHNYFIELNAALCLLCARFFTLLLSEDGRSLRIFAFASLALLVTQIGYIWGGSYLYSVVGNAAKYLSTKKPAPRFVRVVEEDGEAVRALSQFRDPVWCENVGLLIAAKRPVFMGGPWEYSILPAGRWRQDEVRAMVARGEFPLVILGERSLPDIKSRLSPWMAGLLMERYEPLRQVGPYILLVPKKSPRRGPPAVR
jgi:hypothetical protein